MHSGIHGLNNWLQTHAVVQSSSTSSLPSTHKTLPLRTKPDIQVTEFYVHMDLKLKRITSTDNNRPCTDQRCEPYIADPMRPNSFMNGIVILKGQTAHASLALLPSSLSIFQLLFELAQFVLNRCKEGLHILANLRFDVRWEILVFAQPYIYLTGKYTQKIYREPLW